MTENKMEPPQETTCSFTCDYCNAWQMGFITGLTIACCYCNKVNEISKVSLIDTLALDVSIVQDEDGVTPIRQTEYGLPRDLESSIPTSMSNQERERLLKNPVTPDESINKETWLQQQEQELMQRLSNYDELF